MKKKCAKCPKKRFQDFRLERYHLKECLRKILPAVLQTSEQFHHSPEELYRKMVQPLLEALLREELREVEDSLWREILYQFRRDFQVVFPLIQKQIQKQEKKNHGSEPEEFTGDSPSHFY